MTWILKCISTLQTTKLSIYHLDYFLPSIFHFSSAFWLLQYPITANTFSLVISFSSLFFFFFFDSISVHLGIQNLMYYYKLILLYYKVFETDV